MIVFDHYTGFEGEPELVFKSADGEVRVDLWAGYFDYIMENARPNQAGNWESLALLYHTHTGWYDEYPFELVEIVNSLAQLKGCFSNEWETATLAAYQDLIMVFEYASGNGMTISIEYF